MTHYRGNPAEQRDKLEDAAQVCIDGLLDDDTHLIYRPGLSRRLTRLEHKLNLPADERHISFAKLSTSETRELVAVRSSQTNVGVARNWNAGSSNTGNNASVVTADGDDEQQSQPQQTPAQVGKSAWVGRDGEVTVEGWVLEWWEAKGYKG
jgi:Fanconi-associated nuclease 1